MSENSILPASSGTDMAFQNPLHSIEQAKRQAIESSEVSAKQEQDTESESTSIDTLVLGESLSDIRLQFRIDPDTNDITVVIVDRESQQVIRTVPPQELSDLVEGNLLEFRT